MGAGRAGCSDIALVSLHATRALRTSNTGRTGWPRFTRKTGLALLPLRSCGASHALRTARPHARGHLRPGIDLGERCRRADEREQQQKNAHGTHPQKA
ncbi:hypothetical protein [Methylorubrum aminovorans]|uniref:hypothetical protein n=1 Tax=Methylorubrum aminovorans TaxID=269069 RepID=UPI003C2B4097